MLVLWGVVELEANALLDALGLYSLPAPIFLLLKLLGPDEQCKNACGRKV